MEHRIPSRLVRAVLLVTLLLGGSAALAPVTTAQQPVGIYYDLELDEARGRIYASNVRDGSLDVISIETLEVIDHLDIGAWPSGIDLSPDGIQMAVALRGQGEVALVDLETLAVTQRLVPSVKVGPNSPVEVEYGRPGRLYTVGNPGASGMDYLHVFDTNSNLEIARSGEAIRYRPSMGMTADGNRIYIGETESFPQQLYRFDISGDQPVLDALAFTNPIITGSICVTSDGQLTTAGGQLWSADLSNFVPWSQYLWFPPGGYVECDPVKPRAYYVGPNPSTTGNGLSILDTSSATTLFSFARNSFLGPGRLNAAGDLLYIATDDGIQAMELGKLSVVYLPQVGYRHCPGFADTFDYPASGWRAAEDEMARSAYSNSEFRVLLKDRLAEPIYLAPACATPSYKVEVSAHWVNQPGDSYGLVFNYSQNYESYYLFEVDPSNGTYRLVSVNNGFTHEIFPPTRHPAIRTGTQINRLSVGVENATFIQINGEPAGYAPINLMYGPDVGVGVAVSGKPKSEVGFDDFRITSPFSSVDYPNPYP